MISTEALTRPFKPRKTRIDAVRRLEHAVEAGELVAVAWIANPALHALDVSPRKAAREGQQ